MRTLRLGAPATPCEKQMDPAMAFASQAEALNALATQFEGDDWGNRFGAAARSVRSAGRWLSRRVELYRGTTLTARAASLGGLLVTMGYFRHFGGVRAGSRALAKDVLATLVGPQRVRGAIPHKASR